MPGSSMSTPNLHAKHMMTETSFVREVFDAREQITARLAGDGISDIRDIDVVILTALGRQIDLQVMVDLISELGITGQAASDAANRLVANGYLGAQVEPGAPGRLGAPGRKTSFTAKGRMVMGKVMDIARNQRLENFPWRDDDIVICSVQKSGTTWLQMICALLIFQTPVLPAPLQELSPWPEWNVNVREDVLARLEAQQHRRFMKTHRRLGQIPVDMRVTYIVIARRPLDVALSFYHQVVNDSENQGLPRSPGSLPPSPHDGLLHWMGVKTLGEDSHALQHVMEHLCDSWARRNEPNVILLHYDDLCQDLEKQMRGLAERLGITVPEATWPSLVKAATFGEMRAVADRVQPLRDLQDPAKFFRSGKCGEGRRLLTSAEFSQYYELAAQFAPPDLLAWVNREDGPE